MTCAEEEAWRLRGARREVARTPLSGAPRSPARLAAISSGVCDSRSPGFRGPSESTYWRRLR